MRTKLLLLSLAACAALSSYADDTDFSNYLQIRIKSASGLVIGGTDKPILVQPADNDDSQVFYIIQSSHSNWPDGRPATYPGYFLVQKSSGKYLAEASFDDSKHVGTVAFYDTKPEFISNGNGNTPTCSGHWVPNDNANQTGIFDQISLNQESHRLCALDNNNDVQDSDIEDVLLGATVGVCDTPGIQSTAFEFELYNYTGDIWLRGPGLSGKTGDWSPGNSVKFEKDAANPGVYYINSFTVIDDKNVRLTLQNNDRTTTLNLSPVYRSAQRIPFTINDEDEFKFVPYQYYHAWNSTKPGVFNITLDLNTMLLSVKEGQGNLGSGVEEIETNDPDNAPARYYNLYGIPVDNPENGIYIRVSGGKASKIVKK